MSTLLSWAQQPWGDRGGSWKNRMLSVNRKTALCKLDAPWLRPLQKCNMEELPGRWDAPGFLHWLSISRCDLQMTFGVFTVPRRGSRSLSFSKLLPLPAHGPFVLPGWRQTGGPGSSRQEPLQQGGQALVSPARTQTLKVRSLLCIAPGNAARDPLRSCGTALRAARNSCP